MIENDSVLPYDRWLKQYTYEINPSFYLFPLSEGGMLFPPNILNISDDNLNEIYKCRNSGDIYLKYLSRKRNIKIVWVANKYLLGMGQIKDDKIKKNDIDRNNFFVYFQLFNYHFKFFNINNN